jgi:hypothetical protein
MGEIILADVVLFSQRGLPTLLFINHDKGETK